VNVFQTARLDLLAPPFFAAAGLLVVSGTAKLRFPMPARRALGALHLPSGPSIVRAIGLVEMGIGMWCLFAPSGTSAVSLSLLYTSFAGFLVFLMRAGARVSSCGCLGKEDSRPSLAHIVLDIAAAATAALVASAPPPGVIASAARLPLGGVPFLLGTGLIVYLAYLAVAYLPGMFWSYDRSGAGSLPDAVPQPFALTQRENR
jgi:hypothetical protein